MLTVDHYELIRRKHLVDGMTQRAISRELGHARNTVAKAITHPIPSGYRLSKPRAKPKIHPVKLIIDAWLEEDHSRPRKQRHTAQRIFERLRDEHGLPTVSEWNMFIFDATYVLHGTVIYFAKKNQVNKLKGSWG